MTTKSSAPNGLITKSAWALSIEEECRARLLLHEVGRVAPAMTPEPFVLLVDYGPDRLSPMGRWTLFGPAARDQRGR
ncbi:hypothetical protein ACIBSV_46575 [Embleya sp. NPDC050154]|uniref:hypothetical protein n=1 Tax=Embleya sp. NPDC050154 TaxID=3363988 RepID=UPI00378DD24B